MKYKVCWVVHGYKQWEGIDFYEIFASVICTNSWKLILALCIIHDLYIHHYDVVMAFLNEVFNEPLYMQYPAGYEVADYVLRLLKTLYGLKQLLCVWYTHLCEHLEVIRLAVSSYDFSVFINKELMINIIIAVYINNLLICDNSMNLVDYVLKHLQSKFKMIDLGEVINYLGIEIDIITDFITVHQHGYIQSVLKHFHINECKLAVVSISLSMKLVTYQEPLNAEHQTWYRSAVGSLIWFTIQYRPDIAYSVGVVSQYFSNLSEEHKQAVLQIFHYLKDTVDQGLVYTKNDDDHLVSYSNSDYTDDITTYQSITEYVFYLAKGLIAYRSSLLKIIALLTIKSEYIMLCMAVQEAMWIRDFLNHVGHTGSKAVIIYEDNQSTIDLTKNPEMHNHSKHINIHFHWLCQIIDEGVKITWIESSNQAADGLTKALPAVVYQKFIKMLYMTDKVRNEPNRQD